MTVDGDINDLGREGSAKYNKFVSNFTTFFAQTYNISEARVKVGELSSGSIIVDVTVNDLEEFASEASAASVGEQVVEDAAQGDFNIGPYTVTDAAITNNPVPPPPSPPPTMPPPPPADDSSNGLVWLALLALLLVPPLGILLYAKFRYKENWLQYLQYRFSHTNAYISCFYMPRERRDEIAGILWPVSARRSRRADQVRTVATPPMDGSSRDESVDAVRTVEEGYASGKKPVEDVIKNDDADLTVDGVSFEGDQPYLEGAPGPSWAPPPVEAPASARQYRI